MIIINCVALITLLVATFILESVFYIAIGLLITTAFSLGSYLIVAKNILKYGFREQLFDFAPSIISSFIIIICARLL